MNIFQKRLKEALLMKGMKAADLARESGIGTSDISNYMNGKYLAKQDKLWKLANALRVDPAWLMGASDNPVKNIPIPKNIIPVEYHRVPIVGSVAAGEPIYDEYTDEYVDTKIDADCALIVKGDSMFPKYLNGDLIYIKRQPDIDFEGQIAAVIIDDEATLKHVFHIKNGLLLKSENPAYKDMEKTLDEYNNILILGTVVAYLRFER